MLVTVRRFLAHEWRVYRDLRLRALADSPDAFGSTHALESARSDSEWEVRLRTGALDASQFPVVALVDDTPVALAWGRVVENEPSVAHLYQVWVAPEYRGQGIGRRMTNEVIAWARERGVRTLRLDVTPSHPAAARMYRWLGFTESGPPGPLREGSAVLRQPMQLIIDSASSRPPNEP